LIRRRIVTATSDLEDSFGEENLVMKKILALSFGIFLAFALFAGVA